MDQKEAKTPKKELAFSCIYFQFPFESPPRTERSQEKLENQTHRIGTRPNTAQNVLVIHSSPQYRASVSLVKKALTPKAGFNLPRTGNPTKRRDETFKNQSENIQKFGSLQDPTGSCISLKIRSFKVEKMNFNKKTQKQAEVLRNSGENKSFYNQIVKSERRIPEKMKVFFKNRSEMRLKTKIIEIPGAGFVRNKKLGNSKKARGQLNIRITRDCKRDSESIFIGNTKKQ